jgi:hypothetical protein
MIATLAVLFSTNSCPNVAIAKNQALRRSKASQNRHADLALTQKGAKGKYGPAVATNRLLRRL